MPTPPVFCEWRKKQRRSAPLFLQCLLTIEIDTLCKNFNLRSPKIRSPGQVKVKNGFLTFRLRSGHTSYPIGFKPSAFHKVVDTYNFLSRILYIYDQRSGQFRDFTIIGQWAKIQIVPFEWLSQNHLNPSYSCLFRVFLMFQVQNVT